MLKRILKNKVLSCLVFIASVCQPAQSKSDHDVVNEWLSEMIEASEKREAEKQAKLAAEKEQARIAAEKKAAAEKEQAQSKYDWTNEMLSQMIEASEKREAEKQAKLAAEKEQARIAAEKKVAAEKEQARIVAEKKAAAEKEQARIAAEKKAAAEKEQARIAAEKKAAAEKEQARIAAEKKAAAEREQARIAAEKKVAAEKEQARIAAEKKAAAEKEQARIAAEKKVAAEKEQARIVAEKKAAAEKEQARIAAERKAAARKQVRVKPKKKVVPKREQSWGREKVAPFATVNPLELMLLVSEPEKPQKQPTIKEGKKVKNKVSKSPFATVDPLVFNSLTNKTENIQEQAMPTPVQEGTKPEIKSEAKISPNEKTEELVADLIPVIPFEEKVTFENSSTTSSGKESQSVSESTRVIIQNEMHSELGQSVASDNFSDSLEDNTPERLGKYNLKTGETIETLPTSVKVGDIDFLIAEDPIPHAKDPVTDVEQMVTETIDIDGTDFLIGYIPGADKPRETIQSDLKELMEDMDQLVVAEAKPVSKGLSDEDKESLENILKKTTFNEDKTAKVPQQDLLELLALSESDPKTIQPSQQMTKDQELMDLLEKTGQGSSSVTVEMPQTNQQVTAEQELDDLLVGIEAKPIPVTVEMPQTNQQVTAEQELDDLLVEIETKPTSESMETVQTNQQITMEMELTDLLAKTEKKLMTSESVQKTSLSVIQNDVVELKNISQEVSSLKPDQIVDQASAKSKIAPEQEKNQAEQELDELLAGVDADEKEAPNMPQSGAIDKNSSNDLNELLSVDDTKPEDSAMPSNSVVVAKSAMDDLSELLSETEGNNANGTVKKSVTGIQKSSDDTSKRSSKVSTNIKEEKLGFFQRIKSSMMSIFACGALAGMTCLMAKIRRSKTPQPTPPTPKDQPQSLPVVEVQAQSLEKKENSSLTERREKLAGRILDIKGLSEIKEKRAALTREMAKAQRHQDEARIEAIKEERKRLTEKKKAICLRMTGAQRAEIKEQRRLLTKQMTIARRRNDEAAKAQIQIERQRLNAKVKALNAFVQKADYRKVRKSYMKPQVLALLRDKQREFSRAA